MFDLMNPIFVADESKSRAFLEAQLWEDGRGGYYTGKRLDVANYPFIRECFLSCHNWGHRKSRTISNRQREIQQGLLAI